ncbi:phospholipid carrier-dependent glycosyltransferase [Candidatus Microgenomates bacterium]|nr:phospholipid carrier-dependent glycosyltransferase [Candidatus Microgenomates bacterium]
MRRKIRYFADQIFKKKKAITLIFILGLSLRLLGTYPGYPLTHPDESTIQTASIEIAFKGNFLTKAYYYGQLLPLIYAFSYLFYLPLAAIFFLPNLITTRGLNHFGEEFYKFLTQGFPLHQQTFWSVNYWARYDSAIISSLTIIVAYLLGKKLFNKHIGLTVAFLIAINYRHVLSSRLILADAPAAFFAILAVLLFTRLLQKTSLKNYLLAGVGLGLSLSVKYFIYVIPAFLLCHLSSSLKTKGNVLIRLVKVITNYKLFLSVLTAVILLLIINPYFLFAQKEAAYYWIANSARYGLRFSLETLQNNNFSFYSLYYLFYYGLSPIISILTILGFIWSFIRYPKAALIISIVIIPYLYTFLVISGTGIVRNYAAIIPLLLFFPAVIIADLILFLHRIKFSTIIITLLILTIGYQSLKYSLTSGYYLTQEQNMISLYKWMDKNLPEDSKIIGSSGIFYPAGRNFEGIKLDVNLNNLMSMEELQEQPTPWLIFSSIPQDVTENFLLNNEIARKSFISNFLPSYLTNNTYNTLVFKELADFRVAEFAKPLTQDPPFMVIKIPQFDQAKKETTVARFKFTNSQQLNNWSYNFYPTDTYQYTYENGVVNFTQKTPQCNTLLTQLSSDKTYIIPNQWYSLKALAKRQANSIYQRARNGFFRLDFYDGNDNLIKTYVTHPLNSNVGWQKLSAAGIAPPYATYAKITFQIDACFEEESYSFNNITLFTTKQIPSIDTTTYHFYMQPAPSSFYWLPQL